MSYKKHSGEFKCSVVSHYLETGNGYILTTRHFGINRTQVRDWVRLFKSQGYEGLLQRQPSIHRTLAFKRLVVETLINESLSLPQASVRFDDINPSTILQWKRLYERGLLDGPKETLAISKKVYRPDLSKPDSEKTPEEMVRELQYMRAEVAFLKKLKELEERERQVKLKVSAASKRKKRRK